MSDTYFPESGKKNIAFLYGAYAGFPEAVIENINSRKLKTIKAGEASIGITKMDSYQRYEVIFDLVSTQVPFFRSVLKAEMLKGTKVVNNPFWGCADDNFFHAALAEKMVINTPKTAIFPSKYRPSCANESSLHNLEFPLIWDELFEYVGFPGLLKSNITNGRYDEIIVYDSNEFFAAYDMSKDRLMVFQEHINYDEYYKVYIVGCTEARIMAYDPSEPMHKRYSTLGKKLDTKLEKELLDKAIVLSSTLDFEFNSVEFGVKDDKVYVTNYLNATPCVEKEILGEVNFDWLVSKTADYLIELAKKPRRKPEDLTLSSFMESQAAKKKAVPKAKKTK